MNNMESSPQTPEISEDSSGADWSILEQYSKKEIDNKDKDSGIQVNSIASDKKEVVKHPPTLFRKIGKFVLNIFNIESLSGNTDRHEALSANIQEMEQKSIKSKQQEYNEQESEPTQKETEEEQKTKEEFLRKMNAYRQTDLRKLDTFLYDQQVIEKEFNSRLTKVDSLEALSKVESSGVEKESITFVDPKDKEKKEYQIVLYNLKGVPFEMLTTSLGNSTGPDSTYALCKARLENPRLWMTSRQEAERDRLFGIKGGYTDTISASYTNSDENFLTYCSNCSLIYGFDHILPNSIKVTALSDAGVPGNTPDTFEMTTDKNEKIAVRHLDGFSNYKLGNYNYYNEVAFSRYDETGKPTAPDYILVRGSGGIPELAKLHACFFGVPIIRIDEKSYMGPFEKQGKKIIDSVNPECSYEEINQKLSQLQKNPAYQSSIKPIEHIGEFYNPQRLKDDERRQPYHDFLELELEKRLEYFKSLLKENSPDIQIVHTYSDQNSPGGYKTVMAFKGFVSSLPSSSDNDEIIKIISNDGNIPPITIVNGGQKDKKYFPDSTDKYYKEFLPLIEEYFQNIK